MGRVPGGDGEGEGGELKGGGTAGTPAEGNGSGLGSMRDCWNLKG